jgi:enoyl-CoA hydratase/carnithine racemase
MSDVVRLDIADRIATVSLNRPDKLNALSTDVFVGLRDAARRVESDPDVRAVLLRGEGRAFCSGLDLSSFTTMGAGGDRGGPAAIAQRIIEMQEGFTAWSRMAKPVVAAVHGYALGGGIQLALAADIRLCAEGTVLSVFEITYGLVPDLGGTHHLARVAGPAIAKELTWTGRRFSAEEAAEWGIVNRVVPAEALEKEARELVAELASKPPIPVALTKELIDAGHQASLEENMRRAAHAQAVCILSDDIREAVQAAFEKRPGSYSGT